MAYDGWYVWTVFGRCPNPESLLHDVFLADKGYKPPGVIGPISSDIGIPGTEFHIFIYLLKRLNTIFDEFLRLFPIWFQ